jgi:hemerythrin superfamily protein
MVEDHALIEELLDNVEQNIESDFATLVEAFKHFEWKLEKHIFVEEKAIFTFYNPGDIVGGYKMLPEITKQHNVLLNKLDTMRKELRNRGKIEGFHSFKTFLTKHKNYEENEVYPRLDRSLTDNQKKDIIQRVNEII